MINSLNFPPKFLYCCLCCLSYPVVYVFLFITPLIASFAGSASFPTPNSLASLDSTVMKVFSQVDMVINLHLWALYCSLNRRNQLKFPPTRAFPVCQWVFNIVDGFQWNLVHFLNLYWALKFHHLLQIIFPLFTFR